MIRFVAGTILNLLVLALLVPVVGGCSRPRDFEGKLEVPFDGPGQLATVWFTGFEEGRESHLVVTEKGVSRTVPIAEPDRVRWWTSDELIVATLPSRSGAPFRVLRVAIDGRVLSELLTSPESGFAVPAKNDRWIAINKTDEKGGNTLEVRNFEARTSLHNVRAVPPDVKYVETGPMAGGIVWSPDSTEIAISGFIQSATTQTLWPTIFVLSRDDPAKAAVLEDGAWEQGGVLSLFWTARGVYGRSSRGLLLCDTDMSGCNLVYESPKDRFIVSGTVVGEDTAMLLVQDHSVDRFETMAKEIHQVNLSTGEGKVILRLPEGALLRDIDWIDDSRSD